MFLAVFRIRIRLDPYHLVDPDPDPLQETSIRIRVAKKTADPRIWIRIRIKIKRIRNTAFSNMMLEAQIPMFTAFSSTYDRPRRPPTLRVSPGK